MADAAEPGEQAEVALRRRRRALELLGEAVPQVTSDETAEGWNEAVGRSRDDELRRDVPPHHGS